MENLCCVEHTPDFSYQFFPVSTLCKYDTKNDREAQICLLVLSLKMLWVFCLFEYSVLAYMLFIPPHPPTDAGVLKCTGKQSYTIIKSERSC